MSNWCEHQQILHGTVCVEGDGVACGAKQPGSIPRFIRSFYLRDIVGMLGYCWDIDGLLQEYSWDVAGVLRYGIWDAGI